MEWFCFSIACTVYGASFSIMRGEILETKFYYILYCTLSLIIANSSLLKWKHISSFMYYFLIS